MAVRTEQEKLPGVREQAVREVDGYIDRVEKQLERRSGDQGGLRPSPSASPPPATVYDDSGKILMQATQQVKPKIILPLAKIEVVRGLNASLFDAFRWAAEMCVYLIKKYPGRVFYPLRSVSTKMKRDSI